MLVLNHKRAVNEETTTAGKKSGRPVQNPFSDGERGDVRHVAGVDGVILHLASPLHGPCGLTGIQFKRLFDVIQSGVLCMRFDGSEHWGEIHIGWGLRTGTPTAVLCGLEDAVLEGAREVGGVLPRSTARTKTAVVSISTRETVTLSAKQARVKVAIS